MQIKVYSKKELAQAYGPELSMSAALNRLASWIQTNPRLTEALSQSGYRKNQRVFTTYQVRLIFEHLGEP